MNKSDLIGYLVVALVIFGPWLMKLFKKAGEADQKNQSHLHETSEALHRPPQPQAHAANMTMAQRIAEARARAGSTAKPGRQALGQASHPAPVSTPASPPTQGQAARQQALLQRRRAQVKAQQQKQHQLQQQQIALRKAQRQALADAERVRQHQQDKALQTQRQKAAAVRSAEVRVVPKPRPRIPMTHGRRLDRQSLRRAILLKEVLDVPVALRDAQVF